MSNVKLTPYQPWDVSFAPNTLSSLKGVHKGEDIYVLASGPSMNYYKPSFFEDKTVIGVNFVYKKFPCRYMVSKESDFKFPDFKGIHIASEFDCGNVGSTKNKAQIIFKHEDNKHDYLDFTVFDKPEHLVVSWSTITSAIHLAYYMGAKNIIVCGHDCRVIGDETNFDGYGGKERRAMNKEDYTWWLTKIKDQTNTLAEFLETKGCHVYSLQPQVLV